MTAQELIAAEALRYAEAELRVVPLHGITSKGACTCSKGADCQSKGKHPAFTGWQDAASADPVTVAGWFADGEPRNIGLRFAGTGIACIDIDSPDGQALVEEHAGHLLRDCPSATTARGRHLYVRADTRPCRLGPGLELKAELLVAPPSVNPDGSVRRWEPGRSLLDLVRHALPECPRALLELREDIRQPSDARSATVSEGGRNNHLFAHGHRLREQGACEEEILSALRQENLDVCTPPLADAEVLAIARSLSRYAAKAGGARAMPALDIVSAEEFARVTEPSAEPLLGTEEETVLCRGGTLVMFGEGGAGKTTLEIDLALHMASGTDWHGIEVPVASRVLLIENEGARGTFRKKVGAAWSNWRGRALPAENLSVVQEPWACFDFRDAHQRANLAEHIRRCRFDVLMAGPVTGLGMSGGGTPEEVRGFMDLVNSVRDALDHDLAVCLVHHTNKAGTVAGAWEGVPDTLLHVAGTSGATRLTWAKVRTSSALHKTTWMLEWDRRGGFMRSEDRASTTATDDEIAAGILGAVGSHPGISAEDLQEAVGVKDTRCRRVRDQLVAQNRLVRKVEGRRHSYHLPDDAADPSVPVGADGETDGRTQKTGPVRPPSPRKADGDGTDGRGDPAGVWLAALQGSANGNGGAS